MSPDMFMAGISALGAIVGVVIGSIVSVLIAKQQIKATVISVSRQQWINNFRECIADFQTKAAIVLVESRLSSRDETSVAANVESFDKATEGVCFRAKMVALLINPNEADHLEILSLMKKLEDHCIEGDGNDRVKEERLQDSITSMGQRILKREWERVKRIE